MNLSFLRNSIIYLLFATLYLTVSCNDEDMSDPCFKYYKSLPPETTSGRQTFGCKINGEDWVAYLNPFTDILAGDSHVETIFNEEFGLLRVSARRKIEEPECDSSSQFLVLIGFANLNQTGEITENTSLNNYDSNCHYKIDNSINNSLSLTHIDTILKTISGTFYLTFISEECGDTLLITDGRFDDIY